MLERGSALKHIKPIASPDISLSERRGFSLTQAAVFSAAEEAALAGIAGPLPTASDTAGESLGRTVFRTGPTQFWFVGPDSDDLAQRLVGVAVVTFLSHSRTRILIEGRAARDVLAKGLPIDLHESAFGAGAFAMTGLHHTPVLLHCTGAARFELYAMRTFAHSVWDWLADAALEFTARS